MTFDTEDKEYLELNFVKKDEFHALKTEVSEIKEIVKRLDKRDLEDSDFFRNVLVNHDQRLLKLEKMGKKA